MDDRISEKYNDSKEPIKEGDLVLVDGRPGRVEGVFMANTQLADDYSCEDTGGVLILCDDGILELHPFGNYGPVIKRESEGSDKQL
jgi:hypothetical protein